MYFLSHSFLYSSFWLRPSPQCATSAADTGKRGPSAPAGRASCADLRSRTPRSRYSWSTSTSFDLFSALAIAERSTFSTVGAMRLLVARRIVIASPALLPADQVHHQARLLRRYPNVSGFRSCFHFVSVLPFRRLADFSVAAFAAWPLNVRVGENSPSLWPTMFSVTYTGMNFLPLCTASVWPMNSGRIVERRDQVRTTFFSFVSFIARHLVHQVVVDERSFL